MHDAPSVSYPVGRSSWAGVLLLVLWGTGALACAGLAWGGAQAVRASAAAAACVLAGVAAACWWWRHPAGLLTWDSGAWSWSGGGPDVEGGAVRVAADLQSGLLLRWSGADRTRWLWVERARLPSHWVALRRAVYSRANPRAPSRAEPPSATP